MVKMLSFMCILPQLKKYQWIRKQKMIVALNYFLNKINMHNSGKLNKKVDETQLC